MYLMLVIKVQVIRDLNRVDEEDVYRMETNRRSQSGKQQNQNQNQESRSILTKTYSFKRMLSFRGSFRSRDAGSSPSFY